MTAKEFLNAIYQTQEPPAAHSELCAQRIVSFWAERGKTVVAYVNSFHSDDAVRSNLVNGLPPKWQ